MLLQNETKRKGKRTKSWRGSDSRVYSWSSWIQPCLKLLQLVWLATHMSQWWLCSWHLKQTNKQKFLTEKSLRWTDIQRSITRLSLNVYSCLKELGLNPCSTTSYLGEIWTGWIKVFNPQFHLIIENLGYSISHWVVRVIHTWTVAMEVQRNGRVTKVVL